MKFENEDARTLYLMAFALAAQDAFKSPEQLHETARNAVRMYMTYPPVFSEDGTHDAKFLNVHNLFSPEEFNWPPGCGDRLGDVFLAMEKYVIRNLTINLTKLQSSVLISAFFHAFYQKVATDLDRLKYALKVNWNVEFQFQKDLINRISQEYFEMYFNKENTK